MSKKRNGRFSKGMPSDSTRNKLKTALVACSILLAAAVAVLLFLMNKHDDLLPEAETTFPTGTTSAPETSQLPAESETTIPVITTTMVEITEPVQTTTVPETTEAPKTTAPPETTKPKEQTKPKPTETTPPPTQPPTTMPPPTLPAPTEPPKTIIHLPYTIPGTTLTLQRVAGYDGIYLEDGMDDMVSGVAMLMVTNTGFEAVEYAKITMTYDDKVLTFEISALKAGGVIVVQEAGRKGCAFGDLTACTADVAVLDKLGLCEDQVQVEDNGDNTLTVTNLTETEIVTVRLFYKYYMADENAYIGGITYTAKISNLGPNASVVINPSHYASGVCEVVMVRTYDTDA